MAWKGVDKKASQGWLLVLPFFSPLVPFWQASREQTSNPTGFTSSNLSEPSEGSKQEVSPTSSSKDRCGSCEAAPAQGSRRGGLWKLHRVGLATPNPTANPYLP